MSKRKPTKGKWKLREFKCRWFCRNCHQRGVAGIKLDKDMVPPIDEVLKIVKTVCHYKCDKPDIRLYYDTDSKLIH